MLDNIIEVLSDPRRIRKIERNILRRIQISCLRQWNEQLEVSALRHPLGFFYTTVKLDEARTLRFHLWPMDWSMPAGQEGGEIHDHFFELNSIILLGSLHHQTYDFSMNPKGRYEVLVVEYADGHSALARTGEIGDLLIETEETYGSGTAYRLAAGVVHRATPIGPPPVATVVLAVKKADAPPPRVLIEAGAALPPDFPRQKLNARDISLAQESLSQMGLSIDRG